MNTETLSLRELIKQRTEALEKELRALRGLIEAMGDRPIRNSEFESIKLQVHSLAEGMKELEQRVMELEKHKGLASWIARQLVTIAVIVVIVYILGVWR